MGIKGLMKLLESEAPNSYKEVDNKIYTSSVIALDASIWLYQFFVQVRTYGSDSYSANLTNEKGEITSHLMGFLTRTVGLLEKGIKPLYVFDGVPPEMKIEELRKRKSMKLKASEYVEVAKEKLDSATTKEERNAALEEIDKMSKRTVSVSKEHIEETKKLLSLMGIPFIQAPSEAEAQCCELVKGGKAFAVGSEDMDTLVFSTPILLKRLTDSKNKTQEIKLDKVLKELELTYDQFVDLCILCGCDYCETLPGIGAKTAFKLIKKHSTIEEVVKYVKNKPSDEYMKKLDTVRNLFKSPEVILCEDISFKFEAPDAKGLINFLSGEKGFNPDRVDKILERIVAVRKKGTQTRLDSFFKT